MPRFVVNEYHAPSQYKLMSDDGQVIYALVLDFIIVYDEEYHDDICKHTWSLDGNGFVYNMDVGYMHDYVSQLADMSVVHGTVIEHINSCKLDNRVKNLRVGKYNTTRRVRSDKLPPCQELRDQGVFDLPKYVRWDNSESKFVIEKHPTLVKEVEQGKRKNAVMSGTKAKSVSTLEKYKDILARLAELDMACKHDVNNIAIQNCDEYKAICECISLCTGKTIIHPVRRTPTGKKTVSKLPEGCGILQEDIPKYCYYKVAKGPRGDKFIIDKHPALLKNGKRQWSTTEKKTIPTSVKYEMMLIRYEQLNNEL